MELTITWMFLKVESEKNERHQPRNEVKYNNNGWKLWTNSRELLESYKQAWLGKTALKVTLKTSWAQLFSRLYQFIIIIVIRNLLMTQVRLKHCMLLPLVFTSNCIKLLFEMFRNHPLMCGQIWTLLIWTLELTVLAKLKRTT